MTDALGFFNVQLFLLQNFLVFFHFASSYTSPTIIVTYGFCWGHDTGKNHLLVVLFLQKMN